MEEIDEDVTITVNTVDMKHVLAAAIAVSRRYPADDKGLSEAARRVTVAVFNAIDDDAP